MPVVSVATREFVSGWQLILYRHQACQYLISMRFTPCHVRRATLEDLGVLRYLWKECLFPVAELERRLTEFQIVTTSAGDILGAIGLHIFGHIGLIHSEAYLHPESEDRARPLVWEKLQRIAHNHGLLRFWTTEAAPFWRNYAGFRHATAEEIAELPIYFGDLKAAWLVLVLREEHAVQQTLEQSLALIRQTQEENRERMRSQIQRVKQIATIIAILLFLAVVLIGIFVLRRLPQMR